MDEEKLIYCEKCGYANNAGAKFCSGCGKPLFEDEIISTEAPVEKTEVTEAEAVETDIVVNGPAAEAVPLAGEEPYSYVDPSDDSEISVERNQRSLEDIKTICGSTPALLLTLLLTAEIALTIYLSLASPLAAIIAMIPTAIIAIGCWITWISSKAGRPATGGFTLMSGVMIFYIIMTIIAFVAFVILYVFAFIKTGSDQYMDLIVSAAFTVIAFFLIFLAYKKIRKTITRAKGIIRGEEDTWFSSAYIRILLWIGLILGILGAAALIFTKFAVPIDQLTYEFQEYMNVLQNTQGLNIAIPQQFFDLITQFFTTLTSWTIIADAVISALITLFSLILLKKIKKAVKEEKTI